jgi:hypothetical protein
MTVYIGFDWSQAKHDVCMLNEAGAAVAQFVMPHTAEGCWSGSASRWG